MTDREKVIKGLECCDNDDCDNCPYFRSCVENDFGTCRATLHRDALVLLKAQEPRVMTLEELSGIYVEFKGDLVPMSLPHFDLGKIICSMQDGWCRLWSSKPSVEQREDTPWED